jgi:hypothetical protein
LGYVNAPGDFSSNSFHRFVGVLPSDETETDTRTGWSSPYDVRDKQHPASEPGGTNAPVSGGQVAGWRERTGKGTPEHRWCTGTETETRHPVLYRHLHTKPGDIHITNIMRHRMSLILLGQTARPDGPEPTEFDRTQREGRAGSPGRGAEILRYPQP